MDVELPAPVGVAEAQAAREASPLHHDHPFPGCVCCGSDREKGDGLRVISGPVAGRGDVVSSPWETDRAMSVEDGRLAEEIVWTNEGATAQARRAKAWNPWSYQPWELLGEVQLARGDLRTARQSFRTALAKDHANWNLWLDLAKTTKGPARRQALARAAALAPRSPEIAELRHVSR